MKKYIVTETEDTVSNYEYQEDFDNIEKARICMLNLYYKVIKVAIENNFDIMQKAELYQNSAIVYFTNGNTIKWKITNNKYYEKENSKTIQCRSCKKWCKS